MTAKELAAQAVASGVSFAEISEEIKKLWEEEQKNNKRKERAKAELAEALLEWIDANNILINDLTEEDEENLIIRIQAEITDAEKQLKSMKETIARKSEVTDAIQKWLKEQEKRIFR